MHLRMPFCLKTPLSRWFDPVSAQRERMGRVANVIAFARPVAHQRTSLLNGVYALNPSDWKDCRGKHLMSSSATPLPGAAIALFSGQDTDSIRPA
ncbi:MAG: hypothetical protein ACI8RZ_005118 [Myxococcota bacterium]|jgi:hypothetical protein